jgi:hypothetical protein
MLDDQAARYVPTNTDYRLLPITDHRSLSWHLLASEQSPVYQPLLNLEHITKGVTVPNR